MLNIFEKFFKHLHPLPSCSFLHKASLIQRYEREQVDPALLLSLFGLTIHASQDDDNALEFGDKCIDSAQRLILAQVDRPSVTRLQALVLVINHRLLTCSFANAVTLQAIAARFALTLRLNHESSRLCFLAQEARRRLMWAVWVLDTSISGCLEEFTLCSSQLMHLKLPCRDENFELDIAQETDSLWPVRDTQRKPGLGLLALYFRVIGIRERVLK